MGWLWLDNQNHALVPIKENMINQTIKHDIQIRKVERKNPSDEEKATIRHALNKINQVELKMLMNKYDIKVSNNLRKVSDIKSQIALMFDQGQLQSGVLDEARSLAFNPELYANDGFFLTYETKIKFNEEKLHQSIDQWQKAVIIDEENGKIDAEIKIMQFHQEVCRLLVTRKFLRYVHNGHTMYSQPYFEVHQLIVELFLDKNLVFIQTSNTVKYSSIKTVVSSFLTFLLYGEIPSDNDKVKLNSPKMKDSLSLALSEDGWSAKIYDNINSSTAKLLDLFLELENNSANFRTFECINITFDHEDNSKTDIDDKIKNQSYGAALGDLLKKNEVKDLILNKRAILQVEFKLEYTTESEGKQPRVHVIVAGIETGRNLRIYISNNDLTIKEIIKEAHKDLKLMFIEHLTNQGLKNDDKIKTMLGL